MHLPMMTASSLTIKQMTLDCPFRHFAIMKHNTPQARLLPSTDGTRPARMQGQGLTLRAPSKGGLL